MTHGPCTHWRIAFSVLLYTLEKECWGIAMKKYLPVIVFVLGAFAIFLWHLWMGPNDEEPGYMEPTGRNEQSITRAT